MISKGKTLEEIKREMLKCVVLCANHHRKIHAGYSYELVD